MIVDDDAAIRESLADLLRLSGFEVDQAEHGKAALERICADGQPSLVLLDMMMPVMNGWQFLELVQARSEPALVDLPVVAVTALGRQADDLIGRFGCEVIGKPVDLDQLLDTVNRYCRPQA